MQEDLKNSAILIDLPTFPLDEKRQVGLRTREEMLWMFAHGYLVDQPDYGSRSLFYKDGTYGRNFHDRLYGGSREATGDTPWEVCGRLSLSRWYWMPYKGGSRQMDTQIIPVFPLHDGICLCDVDSLLQSGGIWLLSRGIIVDHPLHDPWKLRHVIRKNEDWLELVEQKRDGPELWKKEMPPIQENILTTESSLRAIQEYMSSRRFRSLEYWTWVSTIFLPTMVRAMYFAHREQRWPLRLALSAQERNKLVEVAQRECCIVLGGSGTDFLPDITHQFILCQQIEND